MALILATLFVLLSDSYTRNDNDALRFGIGVVSTTRVGDCTSSNLPRRRPNLFARQRPREPDLVSMPLPPPPPPPTDLPLRFLRAGKGDPKVGLARYEATLAWRKEHSVDTILREAFPQFATIKEHYKHYFHLRGFNGEPCFYEQPGRTNLSALREGGVKLDRLLRYYTMITEFLWQYLERNDLAKSIYVIDLEGLRLRDFFGEAVDFVKKATAFSAQHYPERAGCVFIINVPAFFQLIWRVVRPIIDEDTLKKIYILRGKDEIRQHLMQRIPLENIPLEYGGTGMALGQAPEETLLANLVQHNNRMAWQRRVVCEQCQADTTRPEHWECPFCRWAPARSY
jgi:CRAL/TRIO domain